MCLYVHRRDFVMTHNVHETLPSFYTLKHWTKYNINLTKSRFHITCGTAGTCHIYYTLVNIIFLWNVLLLFLQQKPNINLPTVVYLTKVSLFSIIASTANFSQYWAVIMAIVGCLALAIVGICFTMVTCVSHDCCLVNAPCSIALTRPLDCNSARWWATSSSSQPLFLLKKIFCKKKLLKNRSTRVLCNVLYGDRVWIGWFDDF